jgi:hypothetical protein
VRESLVTFSEEKLPGETLGGTSSLVLAPKNRCRGVTPNEQRPRRLLRDRSSRGGSEELSQEELSCGVVPFEGPPRRFQSGNHPMSGTLSGSSEEETPWVSLNRASSEVKAWLLESTP